MWIPPCRRSFGSGLLGGGKIVLLGVVWTIAMNLPSAVQSLLAGEPVDRQIVRETTAAIRQQMEELAQQLSGSGRDVAAAEVRRWIPLERPDNQVVYHAGVSLDVPAQSLAEPKVREAFIARRQKAAVIALDGARKAARQGADADAYTLLWRAYREDPTAAEVAKMLGLSGGKSSRVTLRPGTEGPPGLGWPPRSFTIAQTPHFRIFSIAPRRETIVLAEDLERFFEVWSQVFFPLWSAGGEVAEKIVAGESVALHGQVQVVLYADRRSYLQGVGQATQGIEESTGFYSPERKLTLLFAGKEGDVETRYHELTHQLLQELIPQAIGYPGKEQGFWIVEGIASYMESVRFFESLATVGGWESPRLQYARGRWLPQRDPPPLAELIEQSQADAQGQSDLAAWYTTTAGYTHLWMDDPEKRKSLLAYLQGVYRGGNDPSLLAEHDLTSAEPLLQFLALEHLESLPLLDTSVELRLLCLGGTRLRASEIASLGTHPGLTWLDLRNLQVTDSMVAELLGDGGHLQRLNLERTAIGDEIGTLLERQRQLEELDVSFTKFGDTAIRSLEGLRRLSTLWLTGSKVTDDSIRPISALRSLKEVDMQLTGVTPGGEQTLRNSRSDLRINPLHLLSEQRPTAQP